MTASHGSPTTSQTEFKVSNWMSCCPDLWQSLWGYHSVQFSGRLFSLYISMMFPSSSLLPATGTNCKNLWSWRLISLTNFKHLLTMCMWQIKCDLIWFELTQCPKKGQKYTEWCRLRRGRWIWLHSNVFYRWRLWYRLGPWAGLRCTHDQLWDQIA